MAEAALFSIAMKLLSAIDSPDFSQLSSLLGSKCDLDELRKQTLAILAVSLEAEEKHESCASVKAWITRLKDLLYEADDLFDEILTDYLLKQRVRGTDLFKQVRFSSIRNQVKAIRKNLEGIVGDKDKPNFSLEMHRDDELASLKWRGKEHVPFVDPKIVLGREKNKREVLDLLLHDTEGEQNISLIAVVGIGGIGKSTFAKQVYEDEEVQKTFERRRWWACISGVENEKEIIGRIFQSITGESYHGFTFSQLQSRIRGHIMNMGKFLLVLDDVYDENHARWQKVIRSLGIGAKWSKIIVTTSSSLVPKAMDVGQVYDLSGLSRNDAWVLFKRLAYTQDNENDPIWISVGREIVKKCGGNPLVVKSIASLLYSMSDVEEWESFKDNELSRIKLSANPTMFALKLSYHHLPQNLKHCFAYCSLLPKGSTVYRQKMIYLWIAQGYVENSDKGQAIETVGHSYFVELLRRYFLYEAEEDEVGEIETCRMHESFHDLAQLMAGEESALLTMPSDQFNINVRHVAVDYRVESVWEIPKAFVHGNRLRSALFIQGGSLNPSAFDQLMKCRLLRALDLQGLDIEEVPSSIGELKHLRYLNLSGNAFKVLPNSITKLFNLLALDVSGCRKLEALPDNFSRLINLRYLDTRDCDVLRHMPPMFSKLTSLQHLGCFKVSKAASVDKSSQFNSLEKLKLKGVLEIEFDHRVNDWNEAGLKDGFQMVSEEINVLCLRDYPANSIPTFPSRLVTLRLEFCKRVERLEHLRSLPYLKNLVLQSMDKLEHLENVEGMNEDARGSTAAAANSTELFFPNLKSLVLEDLPKLELHHQMPPFPQLSALTIKKCPLLKSIPQSPSLQEVYLYEAGGLKSFQGERFASLWRLSIIRCSNLENVSLAAWHINVLRELEIHECRKLDLWEEAKRGVDWLSIPSLRILRVERVPDLKRLPDCIRHLQNLGKLQLIHDSADVAP